MPTKEYVRKFTNYTGIHNGVSFLIVSSDSYFLYDEKYKTVKWTSYILLSKEMFEDCSQDVKDEIFLELIEDKNDPFGYPRYPYSRSDILTSIKFHGGISYYDIKTQYGDKYVKIGCDYTHDGEEGIKYSLEDVVWDIKKAIDSLIALVPDIKVKDEFTGQYVPVTKI